MTTPLGPQSAYSDTYGDTYGAITGGSSTYPANYPGVYGGGGGGGAGTASEPFTLTVTDQAQPQAPAGLPWRFLWGGPQPAGGITGEIIQAQQRTVTLRCAPDQNSEASVNIDGRSAAAGDITELRTDLTVMYGTQIVFQGRIGASQDDLDATQHRVTLSAFDYKEILSRRMLLPGDTLSFPSTDVAAIAWSLVQATQGRAGGNLGIARGAGQSTGITGTWTFAAGDYIAGNITAMAQAAQPFEWAINPYGLADLRLDIFAPNQGRNRGVVLEYGGDRVASVTRNIDPSAYANEVYVTGDSTRSLTAQVIAADMTSRPEGLFDSVIGTSLKTSASLTAYAQGQLALAEVVTPSYTVVLHPGAWGGPTDIWLGDTVTLWLVSGRLNIAEQLRVMEMDFGISADDVETLTLTLGSIPFRVHKQIPKILRRLRLLETR